MHRRRHNIINTGEKALRLYLICGLRNTATPSSRRRVLMLRPPKSTFEGQTSE